MKSILEFILKILAKAVLRKYKPQVVGITGSVGKTSAKEAIYAVLKTKYKVRRGMGNLNNSLGVPLTILSGYYEDYKEVSPWFFWPKVVLGSLSLLFTKADYPEILILELGADHPGDIGYLVKMVKPFIGVVTEIGDIPVHVEFYSGPKHLAEEKSRLISSLPSNGFAILNTDDDLVLDMKNQSRAKVMTYGFGRSADMIISDLNYNQTANLVDTEMTFKISYAGSFVPFRLHAFGKSQAYATVAAASVGVSLGMNLVEVAQAMKEFKPPIGRLNLIRGIKNTVILDDTYNASPSSMHLALDILGQLQAKRKVAILADMLELGEYTEEAHRSTGNLAAESADVLICVGSRAMFIADSAGNQLAPSVVEGMSKENILRFSNVGEALKQIDGLIKEGDLVLVKGSQSMRMEKLVESIMAEPEKAGELLVRQGKNWKKQ
ncbi:MAG: UDP-N-acetylmuramoyl-tripeptide--D-alanyl-D-alanine ligase [Parcubacteria group bacterium]|nr:UDP-N-acetylmuramoyl-tripeptide--D-alanyl-D-alanine ligase [Parcubacteria group bacterium]